MKKAGQMTLAEMEILQNRKPSRVSVKLNKIDSIVDCGKVLES